MISLKMVFDFKRYLTGDYTVVNEMKKLVPLKSPEGKDGNPYRFYPLFYQEIEQTYV